MFWPCRPQFCTYTVDEGLRRENVLQNQLLLIESAMYVRTYLRIAHQDQFATYQYTLQITRLDVIFLAGREFPNVNSNFDHDTPSVGHPFNLTTEDKLKTCAVQL